MQRHRKKRLCNLILEKGITDVGFIRVILSKQKLKIYRFKLLEPKFGQNQFNS